ncbi:MAG: LysR family transcriptional regulator [Elusimicrobia bacterium]|nr:LysR family transcriptional regulator [Elusimicrobiota bacterium]MDE2237929.1 LysR family transcriptional regulator [Elusimicrobiota bacterium]MDE2425539.1 LysR family transcriptional regulator [Elusimicrobiota bacterium]
MIPLNYHHLYYFWTVGKAGSIGAAAERLYLSQPALSSQLKAFERSCRTSLLERGPHGVTLTAHGRVVFERCERIFAEGEELTALIKAGFRVPALLRVGVCQMVSPEAVLSGLDYASRAERGCGVTVFSGETDALLAKLKRGALDLVVADQDCSASLGRGYRCRLVGRLAVGFVANKSAKRRVRRFPGDLAKLGLLVRPEHNAVRKQVDQYLARNGLRCPVVADSDEVDMLRRLAIKGRGVAALSEYGVAADLRAGRLVKLHSRRLGIEEQVWFLCATRPRANPAVRRALEALMTSFALGSFR